MLEARLRPYFQKLCVDSPARFLAGSCTPTQITLASLACGVAFAPALLLGFPLLACALLLLSGWLDTLDGTVARLNGTSSMWGAAVDILSDRVVEAAVVAALFAVAPHDRGWEAVLMLSSIYLCVATFLMSGIMMSNESSKSFHYNPGLMERAEAFIFFVLMALLPEWFSPLALLFSILVLYTAGARINEMRRYAEAAGR